MVSNSVSLGSLAMSASQPERIQLRIVFSSSGKFRAAVRVGVRAEGAGRELLEINERLSAS